MATDRIDGTKPSANLPRKKCTLPPQDTVVPTKATAPMNPPDAPTKRARRDAPSHHRPMQLNLESEVDVGYQQLDFDRPTTVVNLKTVAAKRAAMKTGAVKPALPMRRVAMKTGLAMTTPKKMSAATTTAMRMMDKGKAKVPEFQQVSSSNHRHVPSYSHFDAVPDEDDNDPISVNGDTEIDTMADWFDEDQLDELSHKQSSKYKEAMKIERATWKDSGHAYSNPANALSGTQEVVEDNDDMSQHFDDVSSNYEPGPSSWPSSTELLTVPGTIQVTMNVQEPLMRTIIQDAINNLRAALLFGDAFPKPAVTTALIKDALIVSAEGYKPQSHSIHRRLTVDSVYLTKMALLPRPRVSLMRHEVKDRCAATILPVFLAMGSPIEVSQLVDTKLTNYNYIYPSVPSSNGALMGLRPYRNTRILSVIRDLYFTGGSKSFAHQFSHRFPVFEDEDGVPKREVPIAMVALVATGLQFYAALDEWSTGQRCALNFSAQAYVETYQGNVEMLVNIRDNRNMSFHRMMSDIYSQAADPATACLYQKAPAPKIDLDNLED